ncbi:helix-turn-helix transcriptional regulator [uncultured Bifidobacterium sp.]|uniref:helix-turn-helix transcriptional regulator n=1 Tax=uncultured Bifidobacterium sp. TaxID=165187 RepID=UPI002595D846|nr:helix-turn-helix transcriptional regulator [uncultured Bifidobacterium sp.]
MQYVFPSGEQLKRARKILNMSQNQLADLVHVSRPTISSIENDRTSPEALRMLIWNVLVDQADSIERKILSCL